MAQRESTHHQVGPFDCMLCTLSEAADSEEASPDTIAVAILGALVSGAGPPLSAVVLHLCEDHRQRVRFNAMVCARMDPGELKDSHPDDLAGTVEKHVALLESMGDDELSDLAASGDSLAHRIYGERLMRRDRTD